MYKPVEEKYLSLMYIMYANTPSYTPISSYMVWKVQPLGT